MSLIGVLFDSIEMTIKCIHLAMRNFKCLAITSLVKKISRSILATRSHCYFICLD